MEQIIKWIIALIVFIIIIVISLIIYFFWKPQEKKDKKQKKKFRFNNNSPEIELKDFKELSSYSKNHTNFTKIEKNDSGINDSSDNIIQPDEDKQGNFFEILNKKNKKEKDIILEVKEKNEDTPEEDEQEDGPILIGLNNIGATCYMNATLQSLSNTDNLTNYFLNEYNYEPYNKKKIMSNEFYIVIKNLWDRKKNNGSYSPNEFKEKLSEENPLFAGIAANDSKDLINFLLERFHNELNVIKSENITNNYKYNQNDQLDEQKMLNSFINYFSQKYNSIISKLFYGLLETKSQCQGCKMIKYNFQIYSFVEFPLEKVNQYCFNTGKRIYYTMSDNNPNPDIRLEECFEYFGNVELMNGDNQMYCNICNCSCDALYGSSLYTAPNNLIINLNRGRGAVYKCKVIFPETLNLYNYVTFKNSNTLFELYAVICHIGPSSESGHFIAFCKNRMDKKWYKYNDAFVTLCKNPYEYQQGMAYILFYQVLE